MIEAVALFSKPSLLLNSLFEGNNSRKYDIQANMTHDFLCISGDQSSLRMQEIPFQSRQIFQISAGEHVPGLPKNYSAFGVDQFCRTDSKLIGTALTSSYRIFRQSDVLNCSLDLRRNKKRKKCPWE